MISGRRSVAIPALNEEHVLVRLLLDLLHEHLEEVGGAHARPRPNLPIERRGQLLTLLTERKNQLELPHARPVELPLWRQLIVIWYLDHVSATAILSLGGGTITLSIVAIQTTTTIACGGTSEQAACLPVYVRSVGLARIQYPFFTFLSFEHFAKCALFHGKPTVKLVLLLDTCLLLGPILLYLFLRGLGLRCRLFRQILLNHGTHHAIRQ